MTEVEEVLNDKPHLFEEEVDSEPATLKITTRQSPGFYIRAGKNFLQGTRDKPHVKHLVITALGNAIGSAVLCATRLETEGVGKILKTETSLRALHDQDRCRFAGHLEITFVSNGPLKASEAEDTKDEAVEVDSEDKPDFCESKASS